MRMSLPSRSCKEITRPAGAFCRRWACSYLTLSRAAATLSGGESQRIRLATQIGSSLIGVLYILDEPSIGLHQRDNDKLLGNAEAACATSATRSSWSSTTRTPCAPPTTSSTSAPARASTAARSSPAAPVDDIIACYRRSITGQYLSGARKDSAAREAPRGQRKVPENFRCGGEQPAAHRRRISARHVHLP